MIWFLNYCNCRMVIDVFSMVALSRTSTSVNLVNLFRANTLEVKDFMLRLTLCRRLFGRFRST